MPGVEVPPCVKLQWLRDAVARDAGSKECAGVSHCKTAAGGNFNLALRALKNPAVMTMGQGLAVLDALVIGGMPGVFRRAGAIEVGRGRTSEDAGLQDFASNQRWRFLFAKTDRQVEPVG